MDTLRLKDMEDDSVYQVVIAPALYQKLGLEKTHLFGRSEAVRVVLSSLDAQDYCYSVKHEGKSVIILNESKAELLKIEPVT